MRHEPTSATSPRGSVSPRRSFNNRSVASPLRRSQLDELHAVDDEGGVADKMMRYLVPVQLIMMQLQYIGLLNQLDVGWPTKLRSGYSKMEVLNINVREVVGYVEIPTLDFRGMFTIVSVIAPIAITLCTLLLYEVVLNIVLYFMLVFGIVVLIAGLLSRFITSPGVEQASLGSDQANIIVGAVLLGVGLIGMLIYKLIRMKSSDVTKTEHNENETMHLLSFHRTRTLQHCVSTISLVFVGLVLTSVIDFGAGDLLAATKMNIWLYVGICFLSLGGFNLIYLILILTDCGRFLERKMTYFFATNGLLLLFQLMGMTFIPVLSNAIQLEMCADYSCEAEMKFNPHAYRYAGNYDTSSELYCDHCVFLNSKCYLNMQNASDLCPAFSESRVWAYPETSCEDQSSTMFRIAGFIAIFAYGLFIPLIYWKVADFLHRAVLEKTDYIGKESESPERIWRRVIKFTQPAAGSLYSPFQRHSWYFMLANLLQRVFVMIALLIIAPYSSNGAAVVMLAIYAGYVFIVVMRKPYLRVIDQGLAQGLACANLFNGAAAVYVWQNGYGDDDGDNLISVFIAANVGFPLLALLVAWKRRRQPDPHITLSQDIRREHNRLAKNLDSTVGTDYVKNFFMVIGVFFIIAFGGCILGMLQQSKEEYRISTAALYQTNEQVLAGYSSWQEMTENCCCLRTSNPSNGFAEGERWLCQNGITIERGRRNYDGDSGLPIRGLCSEAPSDSRCQIRTDANVVPYMDCPADVREQYASQVSEVAYKYYF